MKPNFSFKKVGAALLFSTIIAGCSSSRGQPPVLGDYENIDRHAICMGMMAFAADFPHAVFAELSEEQQDAVVSDLSMKTAPLFKVMVNQFGEKDAGRRGAAGYSSAQSLAYVLGGEAVQNAIKTCQPVVEQVLAVENSYSDFLEHLATPPREEQSTTDIGF